MERVDYVKVVFTVIKMSTARRVIISIIKEISSMELFDIASIIFTFSVNCYLAKARED
jgi:hypothetical protein